MLLVAYVVVGVVFLWAWDHWKEKRPAEGLSTVEWSCGKCGASLRVSCPDPGALVLISAAMDAGHRCTFEASP